jgi:hypothetical protein
MTAAPPGNGPTGGTGPSIIDKTPRDEPVKATFENAWRDLPYYEFAGNLTGFTLHQIHGIGVELNGTADTWIVGVQQEERSALLVYNRESWTQWNGENLSLRR